MAKDRRLYMTFPNDFWMHPKIAPLSTEAKWTFVEMNGYSRMQDLDGRIPAVMVERLWAIDALTELVQSHPERPVVMREDDDYVIRDYAEHQQTTADREVLSSKRAEAGRAGRAKQLADKSPANVGQVPGQIRAETETETYKQTLSISDERESKPKSPYSELFSKWYSHYPRKESKGDAWKAWEVLRKAKQLPSEADLAKATLAYAAKVRDKEAQFVKLPGGWLRDRKWEDESEPDSPAAKVTTPAEIRARREEVMNRAR